MRELPTGWRRIRPSMTAENLSSNINKERLFKSARKCAMALKLSAKCRYILEQLCGVYGGEPINDQVLVWPSNELLAKRTGIAERSIRYALAKLIELGVICPKDSPNGKRFARRSKYGSIIDAFGFDLTPLVQREVEFDSILVAIKQRQEEIDHAFDQITATRRNVNEVIQQITNELPDLNITFYMSRIVELTSKTPRRGRSCKPEASLCEWLQLYKDLLAYYSAATGGKNSRHIEHNTYTLNKYCNKGSGKLNGENEQQINTAFEIEKCCPDAHMILGEFKDIASMQRNAAVLRGSLGISKNAWDAACGDLGVTVAAAVLVYIIQLQITPAKGGEPIKNIGGYYRFLCRKITANEIDLIEELKRLGKRLA